MRYAKATVVIKYVKISVIVMSMGTTMVGYQNCSRAAAAANPASADSRVTAMGSAPTSKAAIAGVSSPDYAPDTTFRDPYTPSQLPAYNCTSYQVIALPPAGQVLTIPARDNSGVCYAVKMISQGAWSPSSTNPNLDPDLITRNHDLANYTSFDTHIPYSMGAATLDIYLDGERSLKLAGQDATTGLPSSTAPIYVDNFFLVGLAPTAEFDDPYYYLAYGSSDATINGTPDVSFRGSPVLVEPYAVGGTSTIPPISLDNKISSQVNYTLDLRAIDCGGVGYVSNVYVLFQ